MSWTELGMLSLLAAGCLGAAWVLRKRLALKVPKEEFEHWVHSLMKVKENGGRLIFRETASQALLEFERTNGTDKSCELILRIPAEVSRGSEGAIRDYFDRMGIAFKEAPGVGTRFEVRFNAADIWDEASGAKGARTAQGVFAAIGIASTARFTVEMTGKNSVRVWDSTFGKE